jgi:hypothetical protein
MKIRKLPFPKPQTKTPPPPTQKSHNHTSPDPQNQKVSRPHPTPPPFSDHFVCVRVNPVCGRRWRYGHRAECLVRHGDVFPEAEVDPGVVAADHPAEGYVKAFGGDSNFLGLGQRGG